MRRDGSQKTDKEIQLALWQRDGRNLALVGSVRPVHRFLSYAPTHFIFEMTFDGSDGWTGPTSCTDIARLLTRLVFRVGAARAVALSVHQDHEAYEARIRRGEGSTVAVAPELTVSNRAVKPTVERESGLAPVHTPLNDKGLTPKEAAIKADWNGGGRKDMHTNLEATKKECVLVPLIGLSAGCYCCWLKMIVVVWSV